MDQNQKEKELSQEELVSKMRYHRAEYEKLTSKWKQFVAQKESLEHFKQQQELLIKFKERYAFYTQKASEDSEDLKPIDWDEVEKLIVTNRDAYHLGYTESGIGGLVTGGGGGFNAMVKNRAELDILLDLKAHAWKKKEK